MDRATEKQLDDLQTMRAASRIQPISRFKPEKREKKSRKRRWNEEKNSAERAS